MTEDQKANIKSETNYRTIQPLYDEDNVEQPLVLVKEVKVTMFDDGTALVIEGVTGVYNLITDAEAAEEQTSSASGDAPTHRTDIDQMAEDAFMARCLCGWKGNVHTYRGRAAREADQHLYDIASAAD